MTKELGSDRLLLDVKYRHQYASRDGKRQDAYLMYPQRNGAGEFCIRKKSKKGDRSRGQDHVSDKELAELLAINGFVVLGINLRMSPIEEYDGKSAPGLQPSKEDVIAGTSFDLAVKEQDSRIQKHGLSVSLYAKLRAIRIAVPDRFRPLNPTGVTPESPGTEARANVSGLSNDGANGSRRPTTLEELLVQLDRRSEIGAAGEQEALKFERRRVGSAEIGCPDPEHYVKHIALTDVGRGYDIHSTLPGHERCIEVKSSSGTGNTIFMSDNEKRVLEELGEKAWIYRIVGVDLKGGGEVAFCLNDPMSKIPKEDITTEVWRIRLPDVGK